MMIKVCLILWDQLSLSISSLKHIDKKNDIIFMVETDEAATHVKHHKKKIAFLFSAMRHFASDLILKSYNVHYIKIDDPKNTHTILGELARLKKTHSIEKIVITEPSEYHVLKSCQSIESQLGVPTVVLDEDRFLASHQDFKDWASGRKQLRMEYFYRTMRLKHNILIESGKPTGGKWNYDSENRKPPREGMSIPRPVISKPDQTTQEVIAIVAERYKDHFGDMEPFYFAVTRKQALGVLSQFIDQRLSLFGDYQDAMIQGQPWMYHAHISFYLNCGLLSPLECIQKAENAYHEKRAPLNAVEGFIRQVLGWREYVRGIYWLNMPKYETLNFLEAKRQLPDFYWTGDTNMNCLKQCVQETKKNAYAHHIQRLMVLGNFALVAGLDPDEVNEWYHIVYADAYQWVELPNVSGMVLFADGGYLASKPYAAGGSYINKMSNYCKSCVYKVTEKTGENACPFNYLYWDFLARNQDKLASNQRIAMMYNTYNRMGEEKQAEIKSSAKKFFKDING